MLFCSNKIGLASNSDTSKRNLHHAGFVILQCDLARAHDIRDWKDVPILRHEADVLPGVQVSDIARSDEIATTGRASDLEFFPFTMIMQLRGAQ